MKYIFAALAAIALAASSVFATSFCINVNDPCCTGGASSGTHQLTVQDNFSIWNIFYDTGSVNDKVTITAHLDGTQIWQKTNLCGCGTTTVYYPVANQHLIEIRVECKECSMPPCVPGTAAVYVYTGNNACGYNCDKN